jgi:hypothetical protein
MRAAKQQYKLIVMTVNKDNKGNKEYNKQSVDQTKSMIGVMSKEQ